MTWQPRYVVETRHGESVVIDTMRDEVFCRVRHDDALSASSATARCHDIAAKFNPQDKRSEG